MTTSGPEKSFKRNHEGTKSAFKEVPKRKFRYDPLLSTRGKPIAFTAASSILHPTMFPNQYSSIRAYGIPNEGSFVTSRNSSSGTNHLGGMTSDPPMRMALPFTYPTFPLYHQPPRPAFYLRDPFILAAQNCCAKCGVQFRMTSDLVYHMRTHHKKEKTTELTSRDQKVSNKYRCSVCRESFKEKHHLSRHMTSHDA
ncbi:PR domain zinc finger protein 8 [Holothuria leucospilota]|uniref:PR domain zinc finger protein 8 n=1 Tax=Holothuria leucospilota TaxID=206669 RepID=A0A9Q0YH46_HOLLE|nr:PR domain zinc finger protein 8 [Holothuria leucospilota]